MPHLFVPRPVSTGETVIKSNGLTKDGISMEYFSAFITRFISTSGQSVLWICGQSLSSKGRHCMSYKSFTALQSVANRCVSR